MSDKNEIKKDISTAFDFARFLLKNPAELSKIPDGAELVVLPQQPLAGKTRKRSSQIRYWAEKTFHRV